MTERLHGSGRVAHASPCDAEVVGNRNGLFARGERRLERAHRSRCVPDLQRFEPRLQAAHFRYFFRTRRIAASVTTLGMFLLRERAIRSFFCIEDTRPTASETGVLGLFTRATFTG